MANSWTQQLIRPAKGALVGIIFGSLLFFLQPLARAASPFNSREAPQAASPELLSHFPYVVEVPGDSTFKTPRIVELRLNDPHLADGVAVVSREHNTLEPVEVEEDYYDDFIYDSPDLSPKEATKMHDGHLATYAQFPYESDWGEPEKRVDYIVKVYSRVPVTFHQVELVLPPNVALPNLVAVRDAEKDQNVLAPVPMRSATIVFPPTQTRKLELTFFLTQPLRIAEIRARAEEYPLEGVSVRFIARPNESYLVYLGAAVPVVTSYPQRPFNLPVRQEIQVTSKNLMPNQLFRKEDSDHDGIPDSDDNCPSISNPKQEDTIPSDPRGDICEDWDSDGVINELDNCPSVHNPRQIDTDGDEVGDACDEEESRVSERYPWVPWVSFGIAAAVLAILFHLALRERVRLAREGSQRDHSATSESPSSAPEGVGSVAGEGGEAAVSPEPAPGEPRREA